MLSRTGGLALLTHLPEALLPPPVRGRAADPGRSPRRLERVTAQERSPEFVLGGLVDGQVVAPSAGCGQSLLVPHQRQCREVAQLRLGVLDAAAAVSQGQKRLAQPPVTSRLSDTGGPGRRFKTTPLLHRRQKPDTSSRIRSQVHRRPLSSCSSRGPPWMPGSGEAWLIAGCRCKGSGWMATSSLRTPRLLIETCCE